MKEAILLAKQISEAIQNGLPGEVAHRKLLPEGRILLNNSEFKESAILILLYPKSGKWHTVFMKRNQYDGPHSGQISFPGGKKDLQDKTLLETALRETYEETGIDAGYAIIAGELSALQIPVSGFIVHPFVALIDHEVVFNPDKSEVDYLIEVSLSELMASSVLNTRKMLIRNTELQVPYFEIHHEIIWGATAMILNEFLELNLNFTSD